MQDNKTDLHSTPYVSDDYYPKDMYFRWGFRNVLFKEFSFLRLGQLNPYSLICQFFFFKF